MLVCAQNVFAYDNFKNGCNKCHTASDIHSKSSHTTCTNCHPTTSGGAGTVVPSKCIVCHPRGNPGKCNLTKTSNHASVNCASCHTECKSTGTGCPATQVLGDEDPGLATLRDFRDKVLNKSALGKGIINMYYNNADAINAALDKNPALKAFSHKALQSFISAAEIFM
jgi:hypothetical protein